MQNKQPQKPTKKVVPPKPADVRIPKPEPLLDADWDEQQRARDVLTHVETRNDW